MMNLPAWMPTILWILSTGAGSAFWFYRMGRKAGQQDSRTRGALRRSTDEMSEITATVHREFKRVEAAGQTKADATALIATEDRLNLRLTYLDNRLHEMVTRYDKRFDDGSSRMSKISGQVTEMVDQVRQELLTLRERLIRVEERQKFPARTNGGE